MKTYKKIGFVIADEMEYIPFCDAFKKEFNSEEKTIFGDEAIEFTNGDQKIVGIKAGIGKVNAAIGTSALINYGADLIVNIGLCGGIAHVYRSEVVIANEVTEADFDLTAIGYPLGKKTGREVFLTEQNDAIEQMKKLYPDMQTVKCGTGDIFLSDEEKKEFFKKTFEINIFEMELGAIAETCQRVGVPFLSLKKVSDEGGEDSANQYREMNDNKDGELSVVALNFIKSIK